MYIGFVIGYTNFIIFMLLLTGLFILQFDVKGYKNKNMNKEERVSRWLGWFNLVLGAVGFIGNWIYQKWL